ncbi:4-alpha-glucanotransferase [Actinoplanes teichomyceticus]|uniref:4-alpha-glucanotransferase n=1 Tax=Actinoplanes teichomyceticus TaxID=1867 RepID=A0A561WBA2_ACTTI|nr:4-alpha-glucanotransferase [Actinoplanes teichomyceticus]TWG21142.1 4-alpha-glucanotransferase [Actinoplanes teichomyceticus]GIF14963.1 4-alpha-glucanotransferase [Actinoplanes teichomyceticus]
MTASSPAGAVLDSAALGIVPGYTDAFGVFRGVADRTWQQLTDRFGRTAVPGPDVLIATPGRWHPRLSGRVEMEDSTVVRADGFVDRPGYHRLTTDDGASHLLLVAPETLPQPPRSFGLAVQLYAARSRESWGIGDFRDLALIARSVAARRAGMIMVSPIHAMAPVTPAMDSPYSPASRQWLNVLHIAPGDAPGAERVDLSDLAAAGRALNARRRIDRDAVARLKSAALERIWAAVRDEEPAEFRAWAAGLDPDLTTFATWCVLAETYGGDWRQWPAGYAHPRGGAVAAFAREHADRVRFHMWCQWVADRQLAVACHSGVTVCLDVAVGFDFGSADAWQHQDLLAFDFEVGCPADPWNREGQRWSLPPFDPHALTAAGFAPFVALVRASLRHAGALRLDHVMQLWQLFWVPVGGSVADGAYVRYPVDELLAVLRIEACRAGAWIVGEDIGTVAPQVRETMAAIGMLGYRTGMGWACWANPEGTMGAADSHDQATIAGILTGSDEAAMDRIGKTYDAGSIAETRRELCERAGIDPAGRIGPEQVAAAVVAEHRGLAGCPSRVVVATLDDVAGVAERPNMPGTVHEYPNWRIALPQPVEDLLCTPLAGAVLDALAGGRATSPW